MNLDYIRKHIDNNGIKHTWVADKLQISKSYLSLILSGTRTAPSWFEKKAVRVLKINKGEIDEQRKPNI